MATEPTRDAEYVLQRKYVNQDFREMEKMIVRLIGAIDGLAAGAVGEGHRVGIVRERYHDARQRAAEARRLIDGDVS